MKRHVGWAIELLRQDGKPYARRKVLRTRLGAVHVTSRTLGSTLKKVQVEGVRPVRVFVELNLNGFADLYNQAVLVASQVVAGGRAGESFAESESVFVPLGCFERKREGRRREPRCLKR